MIFRLKEFFPRRAKQLSVNRLSIDEVSSNKSMLSEVIEKKVSGLVIENFINEQECKSLIGGLEGLNDHLKTITPFGTIYGKTLVESGNQMQEYFEQSALLNQETINHLNFDIVDRMGSLFKETIHISPAEFEEGTYAYGTFRSFNPNCGGLHAHAEAEFMSYLPEFEGIRKNTDVSTAFNYLLILDDAEEGGELELYDLFWKDSPDNLRKEYEYRDHYKFRERTLKKYKKEVVPLKSGDLLLFNGVNIWHGVSEIKGERSRKTFAGFMAKSKKNDSYVIYN